MQWWLALRKAIVAMTLIAMHLSDFWFHTTVTGKSDRRSSNKIVSHLSAAFSKRSSNCTLLSRRKKQSTRKERSIRSFYIFLHLAKIEVGIFWLREIASIIRLGTRQSMIHDRGVISHLSPSRRWCWWRWKQWTRVLLQKLLSYIFTPENYNFCVNYFWFWCKYDQVRNKKNISNHLRPNSQLVSHYEFSLIVSPFKFYDVHHRA